MNRPRCTYPYSRVLGLTYGTWAFIPEVYDVVMTGVSSTCIVHLFSHFFPFLLSTFVVANGVWSAWDGYGLYLLWLLWGGESGRLP